MQCMALQFVEQTVPGSGLPLIILHHSILTISQQILTRWVFDTSILAIVQICLRPFIASLLVLSNSLRINSNFNATKRTVLLRTSMRKLLYKLSSLTASWISTTQHTHSKLKISVTVKDHLIVPWKMCTNWEEAWKWLQSVATSTALSEKQIS